jgi:hypothetical protein
MPLLPPDAPEAVPPVAEPMSPIRSPADVPALEPEGVDTTEPERPSESALAKTKRRRDGPPNTERRGPEPIEFMRLDNAGPRPNARAVSWPDLSA